MNSFHIGINSYQTGMNSYQIGMNLYQTKSIILGWSPIAQSRKDRFKKFFHIHVPKFGPEFWVRLKHPNSRINQYQPGMNLYQIGMNLYHIGMNLYQIGINSYRFRFSYTDLQLDYALCWWEGRAYLCRTCFTAFMEAGVIPVKSFFQVRRNFLKHWFRFI